MRNNGFAKRRAARITLSDRWVNACKKYAGALSPLSLEIDKKELGADFVRLTVVYDTERGEAKSIRKMTILKRFPSANA